MTAKIYAFRFTIALIAFVFGISIYSIWQYFQPVFQTPKQVVLLESPKTEQLEPICPFDNVSKVKPTDEIKPVEKSDVSEEKTDEPEFDAGGDYYIVGKLPKGFEDFDSLSISTNEYKTTTNNDYEVIPIPPEGSIFTKKDFKFTRINISNRQISFVTESIKGISYKFVGEFLEDKDFYLIKGETVVLKGRLIKMKEGKKIVEINAKFGYLECC